jgi:hypothetical protein
MSPEDFRYQTGPSWTILDDNSEFNSEQNLFESLIIESNDIFGIPILYYPLKFDITETDKIYGEDSNDQFTGPYATKLWHKPHDEINLVDAFGIINNESLEDLSIPKFTFARDVSSTEEPKIGDVFKFIYNGVYYEITRVHKEEDVFLTKKMSYNISAKLYRTTNSDAETGNIDIDASTSAFPLSAFGDNIEIEAQANEVDDLSDLPSFLDIYAVSEE